MITVRSLKKQMEDLKGDNPNKSMNEDIISIWKALDKLAAEIDNLIQYGKD